MMVSICCWIEGTVMVEHLAVDPESPATGLKKGLEGCAQLLPVSICIAGVRLHQEGLAHFLWTGMHLCVFIHCQMREKTSREKRKRAR